MALLFEHGTIHQSERLTYEFIAFKKPNAAANTFQASGDIHSCVAWRRHAVPAGAG